MNLLKLTVAVMLVLGFTIKLNAQDMPDPDPEHEYPHTPLEAADTSFWYRQDRDHHRSIQIDTLALGGYKPMVASGVQVSLKFKAQCFVQVFMDHRNPYLPKANCRWHNKHILVGLGTFSVRFLDGWIASGPLQHNVWWDQYLRFTLRPYIAVYDYHSVSGGLFGFCTGRVCSITFGGLNQEEGIIKHPFVQGMPAFGTDIFVILTPDWTIELSWAGVLDHGKLHADGGLQLKKSELAKFTTVIDTSESPAISGSYIPIKQPFSMELFALWVKQDFYTPLGRVFSPSSGSKGHRSNLLEGGVNLKLIRDNWMLRTILDAVRTQKTAHVRASIELTGRIRPFYLGGGLGMDYLVYSTQRFYGSNIWSIRAKAGFKKSFLNIYIQGSLKDVRYASFSTIVQGAIQASLRHFRLGGSGFFQQGVFIGSPFKQLIGLSLDAGYTWPHYGDVGLRFYYYQGKKEQLNHGAGVMTTLKIL